MRILGIIQVPSLSRMLKFGFFRKLMMFIGLMALFAAIWIGFPMTGVALLATVWLRATLIGLIMFAILLRWIIKWRIRRKAAQSLEEELMSEPVGDGVVLTERMHEALAKLKKHGGKTYLYDLPWYVIIGPPGAGKTTALRNSGIEFPGSDAAIEGFGGTRNCDWWFAEDAVLIDTAGRYTTQDSDAVADEASWKSFLEILKRGRTNQPINGVILAFSAEDMMTSTEEALATHAETVRKRLSEIHEVLKIDFPVYVMFTKADLISGFREYFSSFTQARRKAVWGATFQTRDKELETFKEVPREFDKLLGRLSDEVVDRMAEEPDGISRVAIFGLPGQMGQLRDNVADFLRRVFEPTRYKSNAILRGFYFTSGTQEGTPIDQVLGAMARTDGADAAAFKPSFMSGKGKSFFLHDLLKTVIFAERDWVSHDAKAVRRSRMWRSLGYGTVTTLTVGAMALLGWSFWRNAALLDDADGHAQAYFQDAQSELNRNIITTDDVNPILVPLENLRSLRAGYDEPEVPSYDERMGLSQHSRVHNAARQAYSQALERMLRPRMMLHLETALRAQIQSGDAEAIYGSLKVYILVGGEQGGAPDDNAIKTYFANVWARQFPSTGQLDERDELEAHLEAMLDLDATVSSKERIGIDSELVRRAQEEIVNLPLAEQAYAAIKDQALTSGARDFNLVEAVGGRVEQVFVTTDGSALNDVSVSGVFTFEGYWGFFLEEVTSARDRLDADKWILGDAAVRVNYNSQLAGLEADIHALYQRDFVAAWNAMFTKIGIGSLTNDPPSYSGLDALSSSTGSPFLDLVEAVDAETRLSRLYDAIAAISPEDIATGGVGNALGDAMFSRLYSQSGMFSRVILDQVGDGRDQQQAGGLSEDSQQRQVERIDKEFADWHALLRGDVGNRPIDGIIKNVAAIYVDRRSAANGGTANEAVFQNILSTLTMNNSSFPTPMARLLGSIEDQFRSASQDATMTELNRILNAEVTAFCQREIGGTFPLGNGRHLSPDTFGEFFGHGGIMDSFYANYLFDYASPGANGLEPRNDSAVGQRLSATTLAQFDRAQAIRSAFFPSGSRQPLVKMNVNFESSAPPGVGIFLTIHGSGLNPLDANREREIIWPGSSTSVTLQLLGEANGRASELEYDGGRWAIVDFLRDATTSVDGNIARVTHSVGGRTVTFRFDFESNTVPFLMPELQGFTCPTSLD